MNPTEFNYETIGFNVFMEKEGGLLGDPEMVIGSVDLGEVEGEATKKIEGYDLENLWIGSWIKSKNFSPGVKGFKIDGLTGKIECKSLEVTGGTISYNKTSFSDSANGGYYIGSEGLYFGAAADANYLKYNIDTADFTLYGVNVSHPTITGIQSGSEISIQGWQQDMTFSASDYRTVAWASGTITLLDGTTYSITGANTGNMAAITYIYLDIGTSTTVLQITTTASDAVGSGKILLAVAQNNSDATSKATYQVFGGKGGNMLAVDNIAANSASVNEFVSNTAQIANAIIGNAHITGTITVGHTDAKCTDANADQTSANNQGVAWLNEAVGSVLPVANTDADVTQTIIDGGMITTGYITLNTAGHIKSGKASYADTAAGWWLGKDSTTPKFNIGSSTKYFKWDGTNITWKGANAELDASGNLIASSVTVSGALTTGAGSTINGGYIDSISAGIVTAGTMNAARINGGDINGVTITGVTVTGGTLQTSTSGKRIVITSDEVSMYNSDGTLSGKMYGVGTGVQGGPWIFLSAKTYIENHCLVYGDLSLRGTSTRRINLNDAAASLTWIQATAATQIQVNRTFIPSGTCDLGISGNAWNNLFVNGYSVFGSYIRPSASNTKDLGTSSFKWRHLYLDQNIYMDSGQNIYWSGTSYYLKHDGNFVFNDDVQPSITNSKRLGYTDKKWHTVHRVNEQGCHLPTSNSAIGTIKKLKKPKIESGKDFHYDKRHYFKTADFPDEMKVFDEGSKEPDKMEIELTRVQGVTLNAVREMVEEIDLLKNRLKLMEKKFI